MVESFPRARFELEAKPWSIWQIWLPEQGGNGRCSCNFQLEPIKRQRSSHPETPLLERSVTQTIKHMRRGFIMLSPMKVLTLRVLGVRRVVRKPLDVLLQ